MRTIDQGPSLLGKVARLHYEHGLTHHEVASLLGLSRVKVTRLLAEARRTGVVEITVHSDEHLFVDLESQLISQFGLLRAWVGPTFTDDRAESSLGALGAEGIATLLTPEVRAVTVGFSKSVAAAMTYLRRGGGRDIGFVPATGSPGGVSVRGSGVELCLGFAEITGGHAYHLPAPLLTSTGEMASVVRREAEVSEVMAQAARADLLIAGMGAMGADSRMLINGLSDTDLTTLTAAGAVGDLCARFFDSRGAGVRTPVEDRLVGLSLAELIAIPTRLVIARGIGKVPALSAALRSGLVNALVTDTLTAESLIAEVTAVQTAS